MNDGMSEVISVKGHELGQPYQFVKDEAVLVEDKNLRLIAMLLNTPDTQYVSKDGIYIEFKSIQFSESTMTVFFRVLDGEELHTESVIAYQSLEQDNALQSSVFQDSIRPALRICSFDAFIPAGANLDLSDYNTTEVEGGTIVHVQGGPLSFNELLMLPESKVYQDWVVLKQAITTLKYVLPKPESDKKIKWVGSNKAHKNAKNAEVTFRYPYIGSFITVKEIDSILASIVNFQDPLGYILQCVENPLSPPDTCLTYNQMLTIFYAVITSAEEQDLRTCLFELLDRFTIASFNLYLFRLLKFRRDYEDTQS